jgi:2'-5' RNA ligase
VTDGPSLRLFFGLWPDRALRLSLADLAGRVLRGVDAKPVTDTQYHLTLAFIGSVAESQLPEVVAAASGIEFAPGRLRLDQLGYFPRSKTLWLGPSETPAELVELAQDLNGALSAAGLPGDRRPLRAHLTLARKVARPPRLGTVPALDWPWQAFHLLSSDTRPTGAVYTVLQSFRSGSSTEP